MKILTRASNRGFQSQKASKHWNSNNGKKHQERIRSTMFTIAAGSTSHIAAWIKCSNVNRHSSIVSLSCLILLLNTFPRRILKHLKLLCSGVVCWNSRLFGYSPPRPTPPVANGRCKNIQWIFLQTTATDMATAITTAIYSYLQLPTATDTATYSYRYSYSYNYSYLQLQIQLQL